MNYPNAVAVDITGEKVYIADTVNNKIRVVMTSTGIITTFAGSGGYITYPFYDNANIYNNLAATDALITYPVAVTVDRFRGDVYISTGSNINQVLVVRHGTGIVNVFAGSLTSNSPNNGDGGLATSATLRYPDGLSVDIDGNVYISDNNNHVVRLVTNSTKIITTFAGGGEGGLGDDGPATSASLYPSGVSLDRKGNNLYIADNNHNRIRKVTISVDYPTGQPSSQPSIPTSQPSVRPTGKPSIFVWHPKPEV